MEQALVDFSTSYKRCRNSGVTVLSGDASTMSAYKYFENDPVLFSESLLLLWRAGETPDGPEGCPSDFPSPGEGQKQERRR